MTFNKNTKTLVRTTRPSFLLLSPVCIFLGYSTAVATGAEPDSYLVVLVFLGAICAHISVNTFNEYYDSESGLDKVTRRTPFSGGSGALQENPGAAPAVFNLAILTLAVTILLGAYFIYLRGFSLLILLLTGVSIILAYTRWLNRQPLLCFIAPGLGFGLLYVVGSHVVLSGEYNSLAIYVSLVPLLLTSNLLLLNQYPDIHADTTVGRRHFPIVYGIQKSNVLYGSAAAFVILHVVYGVYASILPFNSIYALLPMLLIFVIIPGLGRDAGDTGALVRLLALNVLVTLLTPLLLGISLLVS